MFKFLLVIFFLFLFLIFLMGFSIVRGVKNFLFGGGDNYTKKQTHHKRTSNSSNSNSQRYSSSQYEDNTYREKKKVYSRDEGEYVDYEEVKD